MYSTHPGYLSAKAEQHGIDRKLDGTPIVERPSPRQHASIARYFNVPPAPVAVAVRPRRVTLWAR